VSLFPPTDALVAELERLLAVELPASQAIEPQLRELSRQANRARLRIANPVRVAIVGLPGAGKSSLAAFLSGTAYPDAATPDGRHLPVVLRFGERMGTSAGWWSGIEIPQDSVDFVSAAAHGPDYVELRLPNPVLQYMSFLDTPGVAAWSDQKQQMRWVSSRADILLWCTNAGNPWLDDEWQLWSLVPQALHRHSLLVATHADQVALRPGERGVAERLGALAGGQFRGSVGITTPAALAAAPGGRVDDAGAWEKSGGRGVVTALLALAREIRLADVAAARDCAAALSDGLFGQGKLREDAQDSATEAGGRRWPPEPRRPADQVRASGEDDGSPRSATSALARLSRALGSAQGETEDRARPSSATAEELSGDEEAAPPHEAPPAPAAPAATPSAEATAPAIEVPSAPGATAAGARLIECLANGIDELAQIAGGADFKDWQFMAAMTELADDLSAASLEPGAFRPDGTWIRGEIEEALVALSLLQMEPGERPCIDGSMMLLQIARDLSWSAAAERA
jgi:hypothetical protein